MKIYRDRFRREISREEARESAINLIRMMKIIYRPISKRDYENLQKRRAKAEESN